MRKLFLLPICIISFAFCFAEQQNDPRINEVLSYWFGDLQNAEDFPKEKSKIWFGGGAAVDQEIRNRFEPLVLDAADQKLDAWKKTPRGRLALIILVDQFTRNIYRGTPKAFAYDSIAQELTLEGLELGEDQKLFPIERSFFYLPLEHAENLKIQKLSVAKFNELAASAPPSLTAVFESHAKYALRHFEIIEKFGRFPHRNAILGRQSTPEEIEFLKTPNSSF
jgi:uncharacterized protein (DUF924 family)